MIVENTRILDCCYLSFWVYFYCWYFFSKGQDQLFKTTIYFNLLFLVLISMMAVGFLSKWTFLIKEQTQFHLLILQRPTSLSWYLMSMQVLQSWKDLGIENWIIELYLHAINIKLQLANSSYYNLTPMSYSEPVPRFIKYFGLFPLCLCASVPLSLSSRLSFLKDFIEYLVEKIKTNQ